MRSVASTTVLLFLPICQALSWTATPFSPASYPLAVRSPYLSAWLPQGGGTALNQAWPQFWDGDTLGWAGYVNVDGVSYNFLGDPDVPNTDAAKAVQKSAEFTSTQTTFVLTAGPVDLTVTFLSPVEPSDLLNQSLPWSYLALSAAPSDGNSHSVQVYTDISAEWVFGDDSQTVNWTTLASDVVTHQVQLESQDVFNEVNDRIQQGSAYYSTLNSAGVTYQTGQDIVVRAQFINHSTLSNTQDTNFRSISDDWPVFALAHDLGTISGPSDTVVYSVGHARDPAIEYLIANDALQNRSSYFWSQYSTATDAITTFLGDYDNALTRATAFDAQVSADASSISSNYAGLVALSVRQGFGAIEITVSKDSSGEYNTSDIMTFLKEISSDGNVNTIDVIYPAWPLFLYTNPVIGRDLILPLLAYQETGQYPNQWACHDMGATYPKALGHNDGNDEKMPIEESGNMLIMSLSYVQAANDKSFITSYYNLLDQWTRYLVDNTLIPGDQISTDDFAGALANQTNLAIKGIIGIKAMSVMADLVGNSADAANYSSIASSYVTQWQGFATSSDGLHLTLAYNNDSTWGLSYNMYADKLLKTNLIPSSVYEMQTAWYSTVDEEYGVPLDTRHTYTKSDWQSLTAAFMTNTTVRDMLIDAVQSYAADGLNSVPLSDWYWANNGVVQGFQARPVVGGHLALVSREMFHVV
ncbi:hypothetical protein POSPLADRAFT_1148035 [Postia placenta MAD-698-R-SB12]|uniref:DUF1793-domain-containing protein n=1 Tax=Postia placenta MAD-698-R-SB12 TaxID=670580 RepID=A0A1X6MVA6_9APHY|nr:hypothetical protein POSPLADRAFT_1148035 [Postia placenta MAD-698-R-SB12]OSX60304.1 hypothetical protein POSPLADRAFT_1148035 [Postia placenta MAD-698-R-SB12]